MGFHGLFLCFIQMPSLAFGAHPTDLAKAVLYFEPNAFVRTASAALGFAGLLCLGIVTRKLLLRHAPSHEVIATPAQRRVYIFKFATLPGLLGVLLILPFRLPPLEQIALPLASGMLLSWIWLLAGRMQRPQTQALQPAPIKFHWGALVALALVFVFFRFVLARGVPMQNWFARTPAEHVRVYRFANGRWFNGESFEAKTFYAIDGIFRESYSDEAGETIDLRGGYIIPPFADAHTHHFIDSASVRTQMNDYFSRGIFYAKNPNNLPQLTAQIRGQLNEPHSIDVAFANGGLTASGGHPIQIFDALAQQGQLAGLTQADMPNHAYFIIANAADLATRWPLIIAGKPDFIKVYLEYSEEYERRKDNLSFVGKRGLNPKLLPSIVARAHAESLRVAVHVNTAADFHNALAAGIDEIAHLPLAKISIEDAKLAAQNGVVVVTTTVSHRPSEHVGGLDEIHRFNLQLLQQSGVTLALGTDDNNRTVLDEAANIRRLQAFDDLTLLKLCVENSAQTIFRERKIGALREGYEASFLALEGDPLADFANVHKITFRFKQGHVIDLSRQHPNAPAKPSIAGEISHDLLWKGIEEGSAKYHRLKQERPNDFNFAETELNNLGYNLLRQGKKLEAIAMFKLNTEVYPASANAFDSLAEAYLANGDSAQARGYYEKVLELLPSSTQYNAEFKRRLENTAKEKLQHLH
ncbi:MAG: amidohydrolase family protein [candidate division KSB1 bacterium]